MMLIAELVAAEAETSMAAAMSSLLKLLLLVMW